MLSCAVRTIDIEMNRIARNAQPERSAWPENPPLYSVDQRVKDLGTLISENASPLTLKIAATTTAKANRLLEGSSRAAAEIREQDAVYLMGGLTCCPTSLVEIPAGNGGDHKVS